MIDFKKLLDSYPTHIKDKILDKHFFNTLKLNETAKTICFPNVLQGTDIDKQPVMGELDFCPDVLYSFSEKI